MKMVAVPLNELLSLCYRLLHSYPLSTLLFTLLTKLILFPVSLWTQRNSIRMVELTPELNRLKVKYYGDKDTIAEETQALYKREGYHPLASTVPMIIQLVLLFGVIGAVRELLTGTDSALSVLPSEMGGITLLMPVAAGLSALVLGLAQNKLNPLQREQTKASQWMTNGLSIAISLFLGAFVPLGVGIYWICSNLFTIVQQLVLNTVMPPKKYVDYAALEESKKELAELEGLSSNISKEDKRREKEDYKRFFSVANKHLVFYSEKSGFYKYFQDVIEWLLTHSNVTIHYVTSDPKDQIFEIAKSQPHIRPYYIGENRLITLFMKMDADIVVMTVPDLENFHLKRSYVRKDIEYIYVFHAMVSTHMIYRKGSFDHYDTIFCVGPHHTREIREMEKLCSLPSKTLVEFGYPLLDHLMEEHKREEKKEDLPRILIAPSHHEGNIMDSCLEDILKSVQGKGWRVVVRPHPQYIRRNPGRIAALQEKYGDRTDVVFETDFSGSESIYLSDVMITDWSGISMEYSFVTHKPCVFINTPMKVLNEEYTKYESIPALIDIRNKIGVSLDVEETAGIADVIADMLSGQLLPEEEVAAITQQYVYHLGESSRVGGQYILERLRARQSKNRKGAEA